MRTYSSPSNGECGGSSEVSWLARIPVRLRREIASGVQRVRLRKIESTTEVSPYTLLRDFEVSPPPKHKEVHLTHCSGTSRSLLPQSTKSIQACMIGLTQSSSPLSGLVGILKPSSHKTKFDEGDCRTVVAEGQGFADLSASPSLPWVGDRLGKIAGIRVKVRLPPLTKQTYL